MSNTLLFGGSGFFGPVILSKDEAIISVGRNKPPSLDSPLKSTSTNDLRNWLFLVLKYFIKLKNNIINND